MLFIVTRRGRGVKGIERRTPDESLVSFWRSWRPLSGSPVRGSHLRSVFLHLEKELGRERNEEGQADDLER